MDTIKNISKNTRKLNDTLVSIKAQLRPVGCVEKNTKSALFNFTTNEYFNCTCKTGWGGKDCALKKLTDSTYQTAIASCLGESEQAAKDGLCTSYGAASGYGTMPNWDMSQVTNLNRAFKDKIKFNADISGWDTSSVMNMRDMFRQALSFDHVIGNWITSQVTDSNNMFYEADAFQNKFTCSDGNSGPPSSCTLEPNEYLVDKSFNRAISLCLSESPMDGMCTRYGMEIKSFGIMSDWDVSRVTNMNNAFRDRSSFNANISKWDTSQVTSMHGMFVNDVFFNSDIGSWKTAAVTDMRDMFRQAFSFDHVIGNWNTSQVTDSNNMFYEADAFQNKFTCSDGNSGPPSSCTLEPNEYLVDKSFNRAISLCLSESPMDGMCTRYGMEIKSFGIMSDWNVSRVTNMNNAFRDRSSFNANISKWDTSQVTSMHGMFVNDVFFNSDIGSWKTAAVTDMRDMFRQAFSFDHVIGNWNTSQVTDSNNMFYEADAFQNKFTCSDGNSGPPSSCTLEPNEYLVDKSFNRAISLCLSESPMDGMCTRYGMEIKSFGIMSDWNVSRVTNMNNAFRDRSSFNANISKWDTSQVTSMHGMFVNDVFFNSDIGSWKTAAVTDMRDMFRQAFSFDHVIGNWITSQVTDFNNMFYEADAFQNKFTCSDVNHGPPSSCTLEPNEYLVDKSFNRAISLCLSESPMDGMCTRYGMEIKSFGIMSDWNVSRVTNMNNAFRDRSSFNANISKWDTSQVTSMHGMFVNDVFFNSDIGSWKTAAVMDMRDMFRQAFSFDHVIGNWITSQVTDFNNMFYEADAFQNKFTCSDGNSGPPSSCIYGSTISSPPPPLSPPSSLTPLNDATFFYAVSICLTEDPIKGSCSSYSAASSYGIMSDWDVSRVTNMKNAFRDRYSFNANISKWDTSQVTSMREMFLRSYFFNSDIGSWKTEAVTDMREMFRQASSFNHDIGEWITSQVTGSYSMFYEATAFQNKFTCSDVNHGPPSSCTLEPNEYLVDKSFNRAISLCLSESPMDGVCTRYGMEIKSFGIMSDWDVSRVTNMNNAFRDRSCFNANITKWDTSQVTSMREMFLRSYLFNSDIGSWKTEAVTDMRDMFRQAFSFDHVIGNWITSQVTDFNNMFYEATAFQNKFTCSDVNHGPPSSCTLEPNEYLVDKSFNRAISLCLSESPMDGVCTRYGMEIKSFGIMSDWDVSRVTNMKNAFRDRSCFNANITKWDTSQVTSMREMFLRSYLFNSDIGSWKTEAVTDMREMFRQASSFNHDIGEWITSQVTGSYSMFYEATAFQNKFTCSDVNHGPPSSCTLEPNEYLVDKSFNRAISLCLSESPMDGVCTRYGMEIKSFGIMSDWDVSRVTNMKNAFRDRSCFNANITKWDTLQVTSMREMFLRSYLFNSDIGSWKTEAVTDMREMFRQASSFNHDIGEWITSQVTGSYSMFYEATAFQNKFTCSDVNHGPPSSCTLEPNEYLVDKSFNRAISLCLSESPMDGVCTRYGMEIKSFGIMSDWDVSRVTNMKNAFRDRSSFNANISKWDTSQVTSMREMFLRSYLFNSDIGSWKTEAVTDMREMFRQASSFNHDIGEWITSQVTDSYSMFYEATAFQNKFTCSDVNHGPPSSCAISENF
ncbi:unnamed protein product [Bathycoccus prasinos]